MPGCIMVMCGLPASGKTTLVSQFVTSMSEEFSCHVVDYDKLMPPDTEKQLIHQGAKAQDISLWKKYREVIISCVDRLLDKMKVPQTVNQQDKKADTHQVVTQHTDTLQTDKHHKHHTDTHQTDKHHKHHTDTHQTDKHHKHHTDTHQTDKHHKHHTDTHQTDKHHKHDTDTHQTDKHHRHHTDTHQTDKHHKHHTDTHQTDKHHKHHTDTHQTDKHHKHDTDTHQTDKHHRHHTDTHQTDKHHRHHTDTHHRDVHHTDTLICQSQAEASTLSEDSSQTGPEETLWPQFELNLGQEENRNGHNCQMVVVIDDNMYYRSMRYDYYQLARKYRLGFCEVYVDCPSDMAVARNRQRTLGRVEENVIVTMATKMEVPDGASYHWEKYSISITHDTKNGCCRMRGLVEAAILDPVQAVVEDVAGKEESRRRCSENVIHQTDQILRKLLATRMKTAKETQLSKADLRSLSTKLTEVKSIILTEMRSGLITFTMESQDSSKDEESELFQFVKNIFVSKLALTS